MASTIAPAVFTFEQAQRSEHMREPASRESGALFDHRTSSTVAFIGKPIPRLDGLLNRDTKATFDAGRRLASEFFKVRLDGIATPFTQPEDRKRLQMFLRVAAGLEDPSVAETLR